MWPSAPRILGAGGLVASSLTALGWYRAGAVVMMVANVYAILRSRSYGEAKEAFIAEAIGAVGLAQRARGADGHHRT